MLLPSTPGRLLNRRILVYSVVFLVAAFLGTKRIIRESTDIGIFLQAAQELFAGQENIYRVQPDQGPFAYPHFTALPLALLQSLLPDWWVRLVFGLGQGLATVLIFLGLESLGRRLRPIRPWHWVLLVFLFGRFLTTNYTHGNLSLWIAALTIQGIALLASGAQVRAGLCLGLAAGAKLTPGLFLVALPFMGFLPAAIVMGSTCLFLVLLLPWPFLGTTIHFQTLQDFYAAMIQPLFGGSTGASAIWQSSIFGIKGTLNDVLQNRLNAKGEESFHWMDLGDRTLLWVRLIWSLLLATLLGIGFLRFRKAAADRRLLWQASMVSMAIAFFSPLTKTYHLSAALHACLIFVLTAPGRGNRRVLFVCTALAVAFSTVLRRRSILGTDLWAAINHSGLMHLGLVGLTIWLVTAPVIPVENPQDPET